MMPLIQPLPNASSKPTEYQKERAGFAELEVELRARKTRAGGPVRWLSGLRGALRHLRPHFGLGAKTRSAQD